MLLEWVEPGGAGTHCGLGPFFGHYPLIFYPFPVNYNDFPPWPLRTGVIPSPVWALWIIPSDPSRWFFPRVCVVAANSCLTLCDPLNCSLPGSSFHGDSPGKNTGVGSRSLLQGILPISSGNFFTYMDSAEDLRGTLCRSLEFSLHPSPSLVFCRVITGCHDFPRLMSHPLHSVGRGHREDLTASWSASGTRHLETCPWSLWSMPCSGTGVTSRSSLGRALCCWDHLDCGCKASV